VFRFMGPVVEYAVFTARQDDPTVREAACRCIAEIAAKVGGIGDLNMRSILALELEHAILAHWAVKGKGGWGVGAGGVGRRER
jgi:hypothetical protein